MPVHLRPSAPTAPDALLCGDPSRALAIAQRVLEQPRMSNHHRGLWGYHGRTAGDRELTVQATGIGGPSAIVVLSELAALGVRRVIRVGTCSAALSGAALGSGIVVAEVIGADGGSAALGAPAGTAIEANPALTARLAAATGCRPARVLSRDVAVAGLGEVETSPTAVDLQTAATFAACGRLGVVSAAVLAVAETGGRRLEDEPLEAMLLRLAVAAAETLDSVPDRKSLAQPEVELAETDLARSR